MAIATFTARVEGDRELAAALAGMKTAAARRVMLPAVADGVEVTRKAVAARVHSSFAPHVVGRTFRAKKTGDIIGQVRVGPWDASGWAGRTIEIDGRSVPLTVAAVFVEYGHGGPAPARAYPAVIPAVESSRAAAMQAVEARARKNLDRLTRNAARRGRVFGA